MKTLYRKAGASIWKVRAKCFKPFLDLIQIVA